MKDSILEFSSLHPAQLIGKKKQYISATNQDGIVNENRYSWQDTLSKEIIWDTGVGTLSPLVYSIPIYYGFQFASNGSPMLGSTMLIVGTILVFGDVIFMPISTLLEERKENSHISFSFAPLSKCVNTLAFNTAIYTVLFPAKLITKLGVKIKLHHQNKLLETTEGREVLIQELAAKKENKENKATIKTLERELKQARHSAKIATETNKVNEKNKDMRSRITSLKLIIDDYRKL